MNGFNFGDQDFPFRAAVFAEFARRDLAVAPVTHVAGLNELVFGGFRDADEIEIPALHVVEHGVIEIRTRLVPRLLFEIDLDVVVFEDSAMTSKDYPTQQFQIFRTQFLHLSWLEGSFPEI